MNHVSARIAAEPTSRAKAAIAAFLALFLVLAGSLTAPPAFAAGPALSAPDLPRAGGTITVTGSGYNTADPGVYVGLRAQGAAADTYTVWVAVGNATSNVGLATAPLEADGSFSVQVPVPAFDGTVYTLFSRKAHGVQDPSQTLTTVLAYEAAPAASTTTTLVVSPADTAPVGADVTLTATVAPAASGSVEFFDGTTSLGSADVAGDSASLTTATLAAGSRALSAVFTPADAAAFTGSTSGTVTFAVAEPTPQPVPVTVAASKTAELDRDGETVTVTGSGFVESAPATNGTRPPFADVFAGAYVVFGKFPDAWKPSDGVPSSARKVLVQKWGVHAAQFGGAVNANNGGFVLPADGSFQVDIAISATEESDALPGNYGIYTYPGGGAKHTPFETYTPITFAEPTPEPVVPAVTVSKTADLDRDGETVTVTGSGFVESAPATTGTRQPLPGVFGGSYVVFGKFPATWKPSDGVPSSARKILVQKWGVHAAQFGGAVNAGNGGFVIAADGTFQVDIAVSATDENDALVGNYGIYTYPASGATHTPFETYTPITFAEPTPEQPEPAPSITVEPNTNLDASVPNALTVTGMGFAGNVWVSIAPTDFWDGVEPRPNDGWTALTLGQARANGGNFTATLQIPAGKLTPGTDYAVSTSVINAAFDPSQVVFAPVTVAAPVASVEVELSASTIVAGEKLTVTGSGFVANPPATTGTQPPLLAKFSGAYVQFGYYSGSTWTALSRGTDHTKWAVDAADVTTVGGASRGAIALGTGGTFTTTLTADAVASAPEGARYGVRTFAGGGATYAPFSTFTEVTLLPPVIEEIDVTVPTVTEEAATVRIVGTGFGDVTGAYAAVIEKGTESQLSAAGGYVVFGYWMTPGAIVDGAFDKTLLAPADKLDRAKSYEVVVWQGHSAPDASTIYARADVTISAEQWAILHPDTLPPTGPETPTEPTTPTTPTPPTVPGGSLLWAVSPTFNEYIISDIAKGTITVSGGATRAGGRFQFGQAAGSTYDAAAGTATVSYVGSVRYYGHEGVLDVTVANPQIRVTSATSATLYVSSGGSQVAFATLNLAAGTKSEVNGAVTYSGAPATLTQAGLDQVLSGYGTTLGPVTFTIGAASTAPTGSTGTVASAPRPQQTPAIPSTPPTTEGIVLDDATLAALQSGQPVSVSVSGFQPNEEGIRVVVYSTPVLLETVTADASGTATWSGSLPATLTDGDHTLTFQGSVDRGIAFTLSRAATTTAIGACVVDGASLDWGFKESFRTYIEGIAAGGWTLTDVTYEFPSFVWSGGTGSLDVDSRTGLISYGGAIRFEGHAGALDTTLSHFRLELAGDVGYIVVDATGTTQNGDAVEQPGIRFAEFALPDLEITDEGIVLDALPATLTDAGAAAFGTYAAGEELDVVSAVLPVDAACGDAVAAPADDEPVAEAEPIAVEPISESPLVWPWAVGGLALLVAIGAVTWIVVARRRAAASASDTEV